MGLCLSRFGAYMEEKFGDFLAAKREISYYT